LSVAFEPISRGGCRSIGAPGRKRTHPPVGGCQPAGMKGGHSQNQSVCLIRPGSVKN
jgi:hypothetical protein